MRNFRLSRALLLYVQLLIMFWNTKHIEAREGFARVSKQPPPHSPNSNQDINYYSMCSAAPIIHSDISSVSSNSLEVGETVTGSSPTGVRPLPSWHWRIFLTTGVFSRTVMCQLGGEISSVFGRDGNRGSSVVKALGYKSEGRWFDSRWCHWNFSLT